jgi:hypothetical protein
MPQLNVPKSGHVAPAAVAGWQWLPFSDALYRRRIQEAMQIINTRIIGHARCNAAFSALPGGLTFAQVWADPTIWISYDPVNTAGRFGATLNRREVTVSQYCCRMGRWTLVATLIHEFAHVNGADGISADAERVLQSCMMGAHYDATIIGQLRAAPREPLLVASRPVARKGHV